MDELIIKKAQKGDKESFATAIFEIHEQAYIIAYSYLYSEQDSLDAVSNAVEKCLRHIKDLKETRFFKTWFFRCVINECKMLLRKPREMPIEERCLTFCEEQLDVEFRLDFENIIKKEKPENKMMIYMKYYLGFSLEEIANYFKIPIGIVKTNIYGSIKNIKAEMEK